MAEKMVTQRCSVVRRQQPPYQWKWTAYHRWRRIPGTNQVVGCCLECGLFPNQVKVPESELRDLPEDDDPPEFDWATHSWR